MSYKNEMRSITLKALEDLRAIDAKIAELRSKEQGYYKPTFNELMGKLNAEKQELVDKSRAEAEACFSEYSAKVRKAFTLDPEAITSDAKILEHFELSVDEVKDMLKKYADNPTMQRLIIQYANKHEMVLDSIPNTEQAYLERGESLLAYHRSAMRQPEYTDVWENDRYFERVSAGMMDD